MQQEEKWFKPYTWNGEIVTEVIIELRDRSLWPKVSKPVEEYLQHLGFSPDSNEPPRSLNKKLNQDVGWHLDLVNKRYKKMSQLYYMVSSLKSAWPSQLPSYLQEKRGTLAGAKFGI